MKSAEQQARDMLERAGVENAQNISASDIVEIANLIAIKPTNETIERCATIAETLERGTRYQWVSDSLFGGLVKQIADRIRTLKHE